MMTEPRSSDETRGVETWRLQPLGPAEVARAFGVRQKTVYVWRYRGNLPDPWWGTVSRVPLWSRDQVLVWAEETGREIVDADPVVDGAEEG